MNIEEMDDMELARISHDEESEFQVPCWDQLVIRHGFDGAKSKFEEYIKVLEKVTPYDKPILDEGV